MTATRKASAPDAKTSGCGPIAKSKRGPVRAAVLIAIHVAIVAHIAHWKITGSTVTPLEPSESMQTLELGYVNAGFVLFGIAILATLIFGRFFCGWACHLVAYQDLASWILGKLRMKPRAVRTRFVAFLAPMGAAFYMFLLPSLTRLVQGEPSPELVDHMTTEKFWATFPGFWIGLLTFVVCGALIIWFLGAKGFCTYACPYGAFFGVADRVSPGRIRVTDACEGCGHCTAVCTSNVLVHQEVRDYKMVVDAGCMKCLDCVSVCPKDALYFGFGKPTRPPLEEGRKKFKKRYDLTLGEEFLFLWSGLAIFFAFRGLYEHVPFLLSMGLGAIGGICVVTLWRLATKAQVRFQSHLFKSQGKLTRQGLTATCVFVPFLLFAAHSGYVRFHQRAGDVALQEASQLLAQAKAERDMAKAEAAVERMREAGASYQAAIDLGIYPVSSYHVALARVAAEANNDLAACERHADRALEIFPDDLNGLWWKYLCRAQARDIDGAEAALLRMLEIDPDFRGGEVQRQLENTRAARERGL